MKKIKLTQNKYALVDDNDFEELNKFKWHALKDENTFYTGRKIWDKKTKKQKYITMHRVIMKTPKGKETDHIDNNGLNNQRSNLRIVTHSQNQMNKGMSKNNTSGFKGVSWDKNSKKWLALIRFNGKQIYLGVYTTKEEASEAYIKACIKYHGEFANYK